MLLYEQLPLFCAHSLRHINASPNFSDKEFFINSKPSGEIRVKALNHEIIIDGKKINITKIKILLIFSFLNFINIVAAKRSNRKQRVHIIKKL